MEPATLLALAGAAVVLLVAAQVLGRVWGTVVAALLHLAAAAAVLAVYELRVSDEARALLRYELSAALAEAQRWLGERWREGLR